MIKPPENDHSITLDELKYLESVEPNEQHVKDIIKYIKQKRETKYSNEIKRSYN